MNRLHIAVCLMAITACFRLQAQSATLEAKIPFDFHVGNTLMPAGDYRVHYSGNLLVLREQGSDARAVFTTLTIHTIRREAPNQGALLFNRYGDDYFFTKVWAPASFDGLELVPSHREKFVASRTRPVPENPINVSTK